MMKRFCENSQRLKVDDYFEKQGSILDVWQDMYLNEYQLYWNSNWG